jgi:hypothetical protein
MKPQSIMAALTIVAALLLAAPHTAHAQAHNFAALEDRTNAVTVTTGAEHGLVVGIGYARVLALADHTVVPFADVSLQWADVDVDDFRLRAGALAPIVGNGRWKLIGGVTSTIRGTHNDIARMINVGADAALLAGHYARHWFVAGELGFDWAITTHIAHSDAYRMDTYAGARDGWYGNTGGILRYGAQAGVSFGRYDVILRAGRLLDVSGQPPMFPLYATLTFNTRW